MTQQHPKKGVFQISFSSSYKKKLDSDIVFRFWRTVSDVNKISFFFWDLMKAKLEMKVDSLQYCYHESHRVPVY